MEKIRDAIVAWLSRSSIVGYDNRKQFVFLFIAIVFCVGGHSCLLVFFALAGIGPLIAANLGALAVYFFVLLLLVKRRCYLTVRAAIAGTAGIYAVFTAYMLGIGSCMMGYFLLAIMLQLLLPYGSARYRHCVMLATVALVVFSFSLGCIMSPLFSLSECQQAVFTAANLCIMLFGTCLEIKIERVVTCSIHQAQARSLEKATLAANTDALTSAYNRRYAEEYIADLQAYAKKVNYCVAMADIDKFKDINDLLGHDAGDQALIHIVNLIRGSLRKDDMLFRWGGDEFLIILKGIRLPQAHDMFDRIQRQLHESPFQNKGQSVQVSVSVGVAEFDVRNPYLSIERCDQNLLQSKRQGRGMVCSGR